MQRDLSDIYEIYPSYITRVIFTSLLIECDWKIHGHVEIIFIFKTCQQETKVRFTIAIDRFNLQKSLLLLRCERSG